MVVGGFGAAGAGSAFVSVMTLPPHAEREHSKARRRMGEIVLNMGLCFKKTSVLKRTNQEGGNAPLLRRGRAALAHLPDLFFPSSLFFALLLTQTSQSPV